VPINTPVPEISISSGARMWVGKMTTYFPLGLLHEEDSVVHLLGVIKRRKE
jgi:hypothetical protein